MDIIFDNKYVPKTIFGKDKYNRLTVDKCVGYFIEKPANRKRAAFQFKCDCGNTIICRAIDVKKEKTKSCGCLALESKSKTGKANAKDGCYSFFNGKYYDYKVNTKRMNLDFELTLEQFSKLISSNCHYCGSKPTNFQKSGLHCQMKYNGVDRKNNHKGYTADNVVPCCKFCNYAKGRATQQEFEN